MAIAVDQLLGTNLQDAASNSIALTTTNAVVTTTLQAGDTITITDVGAAPLAVASEL